MLNRITLYSSFTGDESLVLNQDALWLGCLFLEGLPNSNQSTYKHISINARENWGDIEGDTFKSYDGISYYANFNLELYRNKASHKEKSLHLLDYLHSKLITYETGIPRSALDDDYQYCIDRNFQFCKRSKRKNASLKGRRGRSCYLYGEINIEEFRLYVIIEDSKLMTAQRFLVATPPRYFFDNFNGYKLKVNLDNTIDIWDASYYKDNLRLEGLQLDFEG